MATVRHLGLFPFCVGTYPPRTDTNQFATNKVGPFTDYPIQLPVRLCTRMWWTVKHWRVSFDFYQYRDLGNGNYSVVDESVVVETSTESVTGLPDYVRRIENNTSGEISERQLICVTLGGDWEAAARASGWNVSLRQENFINGNMNVGSFDATVNFYTNFDQQQLGFGPPFAYSQNDISNLWVAMSFSFAGWSSYTDWGTNGQSSNGTFSLLNSSKQFSINRSELDNSFSQSLTNLRIEPSEFWEYDPGDGLGPIYDKITGKQLRAFPDSSASASASVS